MSATSPAPTISESDAEAVADGVFVIPDGRIELVPNVGVIVGEHTTLVVDTGMGRENGERVLRAARKLGGDRRLLVTITHFHPEHAYGAMSLVDEATIVYNAAQADELRRKGGEFVEMFRGFGPHVAQALEGVELVGPHVAYSGEAEIDVGGFPVRLLERPAHTRGDQIVLLPEQGVLFAGDLVENRFFPILPDPDAHALEWLDVLNGLASLEPRVVVPGHGEVGDAGLVAAYVDYFGYVRERVATLRGEGRSLDEVKAALGPEIRERWASWDAEIWIDFALERFYAELG